MRYAIIFAVLLMLGGCAGVQTPLDDGYQFGDISETRRDYCATADPQARANLLAIIRLSGAVIPPSGICTDVDVSVPGVDVEQAREDQRRFQEP